MSLLGQNHTFAPFISGKSIASEGQRLAQITFKTATAADGTKSKRDSQCVSVPVLSVSVQDMQAIQGHITAMVHKAQDGIIRELVLAGSSSVHDDQISFNAVVEWLDSESEGTRLSKEDVCKWFDTSEGFADKLRVVFANKLGVSDTPSEGEMKQIEQQVNRYRECYASLAGGKKLFEKPIALMLAKTLEKYTEVGEDAIASRFAARLGKMVASEEVSLIDAL